MKGALEAQNLFHLLLHHGLAPHQDISLVVSPPGESCVSEVEQLTNSLPGREMLSAVCKGFMDVLENSESSVPLLLTSIRTLTFLTEHEYGLYHLKV